MDLVKELIRNTGETLEHVDVLGVTSEEDTLGGEEGDEVVGYCWTGCGGGEEGT